MEFIKLMAYAGIYNIILMSIYYLCKYTPTLEALFFGGIVNLLIALALHLILKFTKQEASEK